MTLLEAIEARHRVRAYKEQPLAEDTAKLQEEKIAELNQAGNLHIRLLLAPTAVNQQKFSLEHVGVKKGKHHVRAKRGFSMIGYTQMDLGIAKCHFEMGAGKENFEWV